MNIRAFRSLIAVMVSMIVGSTLSAATITQWNFNADSSQTNPSIGSGSLAVQGGMSFLTSLNTDNAGSPGDTTPPNATGNNHPKGMNGTATPATATAAAAASGSVGLKISASTVGYSDIKVSWHQAQGYRSSRYYQIYATSDGTNFVPVSGGTGGFSGNLGNSWYSSISVSNSGLVDIRANDGKILGTNGDSFGYELSYTFPSGSVYENNPNFAAILAAVWDPTGAVSDYVSSFAGTTNLGDATKGYVRNSSSTGGGLRYDLITVSGVPEPTTLVLAGCGLAFVSAISRRRREL